MTPNGVNWDKIAKQGSGRKPLPGSLLGQEPQLETARLDLRVAPDWRSDSLRTDTETDKPERKRGIMRTSGKLGCSPVARGLLCVAMLATAVVAAELWVVEVPAGNKYVVSAVLVPGVEGGEVCGGGHDQGHVDFRIGFDGCGITVNGVDAGPFDPSATYGVTVSCFKCGSNWFATTHVVNLATGQPVFEQVNYKMPSPAEEVWAAGVDILDLCVQ